ncbi:hypothetical protein GCM10012280_57060 [Wenjunlia tyrosinilytica]|uniref:Uncharacterized protein n=1 Tax=Wenjunlia tyrosinilytica TaxID=1544741 RepID=A0A917ZV25_9ACTN|nr:hypothetical protein GCM10012280_57060 [Wenjunlia tyrosinilytica]
MGGAILPRLVRFTASEPSWTAPFTGLSRCLFGVLIVALRREGADEVRRGTAAESARYSPDHQVVIDAGT